jgi:hypothetical protein
MFLYPILSPDWTEKNPKKASGVPKDKAKARQDMMVRGQSVPKVSCGTSAIDRTRLGKTQDHRHADDLPTAPARARCHRGGAGETTMKLDKLPRASA